jgi:uncharacterized FlaG/YvyC family protein
MLLFRKKAPDNFILLPGIGGRNEGRGLSASVRIHGGIKMSVAGVGIIPVSPAPLPGEFHGHNVRQHDEPEVKVKPEKKVKPQVIHSAAADLQRISHAFNKKLQFVIDHRSNEVIVKVIDKDTDKVIKELPPEELQRLHRNIKEAIGLLFDEMV